MGGGVGPEGDGGPLGLPQGKWMRAERGTHPPAEGLWGMARHGQGAALPGPTRPSSSLEPLAGV